MYKINLLVLVLLTSILCQSSEKTRDETEALNKQYLNQIKADPKYHKLHRNTLSFMKAMQEANEQHGDYWDTRKDGEPSKHT